MQPYRPISLKGLVNCGAAFVHGRFPATVGEQVFHGIPFSIPESADRCWIGFDTGMDAGTPVEIPIEREFYSLLVAHTLIESELLQGDPVGRLIAEYVLCYQDGGEIRRPIRERFEIAETPTIWGQWPFRAQPDQADALFPRHEGPWEQTGRRQTEVNQGVARSYHLWAWRNPEPARPVRALRIEPRDRRFIVAAVTTGHVDEDPFPREPMSKVRITLPLAEDAGRSFDLKVQVDRGFAGYAYPLPETDGDGFLAVSAAGFGEELNPTSSPAYVDVTGVPSATVKVSLGDEELGAANWGELKSQGRVEGPRVALEVVDRGKNWVHTTVVDDSTGKPIPCRIHFRSPSGIPYQPHGHHTHLNSNQGTWHIDIGGDLRMGQITYAYIDGACQGWLPRGEVLVEVARGFEYEPLRTRVQIQPGQRELTLRLKQWKDMAARGWFSGDTHVHFLGAQGAHREAQGEGLNVVNLLQSQWGHLYTNTEDWIGRPAVSADGRTIVYCSQENRQHILGHLSLLGLKEPVMPWCTDGPSEGPLGGALEATMSEWADACHRQGGTVVLPHFPNPNGEPAAMVATGRVDAVEMIRYGGFEHVEYYRYLNCGYRLPLVGGTDKMSGDVPVGLYRTYAALRGEEFTYDRWCRAVRQGRTVLSGGPLLSMTVEGAEIGDTVRLPRGGGTVEVHAVAESIFPIHCLQLVEGGRVVAEASSREGTRRLELREQVKVEQHSWVAARCGGPNYNPLPHHDVWRRGIFAHTSPVYLAVGEDWWMFDPAAAQYLLTLCEGGLEYVRHTARHHHPDDVTHHHGMESHLDHLEEPFQQAIRQIHQRMHQLGIPH